MEQESLIYKICRPNEYQNALEEGYFGGSPDDRRDGFIHFSTAAQVPGTLSKHFAGETDLILLKLETASLGNSLAWETSRGGDIFPHLYAELDMSLVVDKETAIWSGSSHKISEGFFNE